jgi:hypothetical protein
MVQHVVVCRTQLSLVVRQQLVVVYQPVYMVVNLVVILLPVCMMVWDVVAVVLMLPVVTIRMDDRRTDSCRRELCFTFLFGISNNFLGFIVEI